MKKLSNTSSLSEARRQELLRIARYSRKLWILSARDINDPGFLTSTIFEAETLIQKIPSAGCIQNTLSFLNKLVDDDDPLDLTAITLTMLNEQYDDENEMYKPSSEPMNGYNKFLCKLLDMKAFEIVKSLQQFITKFIITCKEKSLVRITVEEENHGVAVGKIWTFIDQMYNKLRMHSMWEQESLQEFELTKEYLERFIFTKLHPVIFATDYDDSILNQSTYERIQSLSFLAPEHLDIKSIKFDVTNAPTMLMKPIQYLKNLQQAKCPQDKMLCVRNCSMAIAQLLKEHRGDNKSIPGADELLPMMILTIKTCNPIQIHSELKYLQRYTRPAKLVSESGYLLTNLVSAVFFLDNVDAKALTIDPEEFDRSIHQAKIISKENTSQLIERQQRNLNKLKLSYQQKLRKKSLSTSSQNVLDSVMTSYIIDGNGRKVPVGLDPVDGLMDSNRSRSSQMDGNHWEPTVWIARDDDELDEDSDETSQEGTDQSLDDMLLQYKRNIRMIHDGTYPVKNK